MARKSLFRCLSVPFLATGMITSVISPSVIASDDTFLVQRGIAGKGEGNDIYVLSSNLIDTNAQITISDTQGSNSLQLIGGLNIASSIVASDTVQLTLSNDAVVTVLGAGSMSYTLGGGSSLINTNGKQGQFDASLEEVWHLITHTGYSTLYPNIFGESVGCSLANAMDVARGGQFITLPSSYPESAWYSYNDETCDYACMATEYFYWGMTSVLGAQSERLSEIQEEWRLNTSALMQSADTALYNLLTDSQYKLPTVLPDRSYKS